MSGSLTLGHNIERNGPSGVFFGGAEPNDSDIDENFGPAAYGFRRRFSVPEKVLLNAVRILNIISQTILFLELCNSTKKYGSKN